MARQSSCGNILCVRAVVNASHLGPSRMEASIPLANRSVSRASGSPPYPVPPFFLLIMFFPSWQMERFRPRDGRGNIISPWDGPLSAPRRSIPLRHHRIFDAPGMKLIRQPIAFGEQDKALVILGTTVYSWGYLGKGEAHPLLVNCYDPPSCIAAASDNVWLGSSHTVQVLDPASSHLSVIADRDIPLQGIASLDRLRVVATWADNTLTIHDSSASKKPAARIAAGGAAASCSVDGVLIATTGGEVWDIRNLGHGCCARIPSCKALQWQRRRRVLSSQGGLWDVAGRAEPVATLWTGGAVDTVACVGDHHVVSATADSIRVHTRAVTTAAGTLSSPSAAITAVPGRHEVLVAIPDEERIVSYRISAPPLARQRPREDRLIPVLR